MEIADCTVRIAGSLLHTVPKQEVTPAEVQVLQFIHGADAVVDVRPLREERRPHAREFDRLLFEYRTNAGGADGEQAPLLERLFPGALKRLPETFAEIGIGAAPVADAEEDDAAGEDGDDGPLDHDGDGRPGGSLPGEESTARRGRRRRSED